MKNTDLLKALDKGIDDVENGRVTSPEKEIDYGLCCN